jgi:glycine cleavage system transcriptional repressor
MREGLILSAIGQDRPGIVDRISGAVYQAGCNLEDSRMAILGGEFALLVLVAGSSEQLERAQLAVEQICKELDLLSQWKSTVILPPVSGQPGFMPYRVTAVAMDQPGIVHKIAHVLVQEGVNVADLETRLSHAPDSGAPLFSLELLAQVPAGVSIATLREALRELSERENIDLELRAKR